MCDSGTESDLESYTSLPAQDISQRQLSSGDYNDSRYFDVNPRSASYRSSTDLNSSSSRSSSFDTRNGAAAGANKPHKAQDLAWESIRTVKSRDGNVCLSHFRFLQRLGSGDIGSVYLAELRGTSCYFAIKVMDKRALAGRNKLLRAQTEREILEALDHPFLPTLYAHVDERQFSCLVMEFCPGGDLHVLRQRQSFKRFGENAVRFYAAEVLLALEYLHMMGIVYRDLKPENVLVREDGHIMLSDFDLSLKCSVNPILSRLASVRPPSSCAATCDLPGFGCVAPCSVHPIASCIPLHMPRIFHLPNSSSSPSSRKPKEKPSARRRSMPELIAEPTAVRSMSFVGTHEYLAPEIILGDGHGSAVDWWTFGIFLYELLHGKTPFKGSDNEVTLMNVVSQPLRFPSVDDDASPPLQPPSPAAQDLIRGLLVKDPQKRLAAVRGASEVKHHAFFEGVNWALIRCAVPPEIPSPYVPPPSSVKGDPPASPNDKKEANCWMDIDGNPPDNILPDFELF